MEQDDVNITVNPIVLTADAINLVINGTDDFAFVNSASSPPSPSPPNTHAGNPKIPQKIVGLTKFLQEYWDDPKKIGTPKIPPKIL